jgi:phage replication-related protein YjqB (UPF0714/DUF867 family)
VTDGHRFPGRHPRNICNRGRSGEGVQLELSEQLRKSGNWSGLVGAIRAVLETQASADLRDVQKAERR